MRNSGCVDWSEPRPQRMRQPSHPLGSATCRAQPAKRSTEVTIRRERTCLVKSAVVLLVAAFLLARPSTCLGVPQVSEYGELLARFEQPLTELTRRYRSDTRFPALARDLQWNVSYEL